jgi:hypothetical protein
MIKLWAGVIQALVNIGRIRLANDLNLVLPEAYKAERKMWKKLCEFVAARQQEELLDSAKRLDKLRVRRTAEAAAQRPNGDSTA